MVLDDYTRKLVPALNDDERHLKLKFRECVCWTVVEGVPKLRYITEVSTTGFVALNEDGRSYSEFEITPKTYLAYGELPLGVFSNTAGSLTIVRMAGSAKYMHVGYHPNTHKLNGINWRTFKTIPHQLIFDDTIEDPTLTKISERFFFAHNQLYLYGLNIGYKKENKLVLYFPILKQEVIDLNLGLDLVLSRKKIYE